ncbi:MAG: hypothetical protein ABR498_01890 [Candidatus Dormibacteria bacterium]
MRELWSDHNVYTRSLIVSAAAGLPDTADVAQRLLRNQDEIGEAIKPYYGDAAGSQLATLLRTHIQLATRALVAAKGTSTAMSDMNGMSMQDSSSRYQSSRMQGDTVSARSDTSKIKSNSQYPTTTGRMNDSSKTRSATGVNDSTKARSANGRIADTTRAKDNRGNPTATGRMSDSTKAKQGNARVTGDTMSARLPSNQYGTVRSTDSSASNSTYAQSQQGQMQVAQAGQVDSTSLNQAIAELKANGDSIAVFLSSANPRGFSRETLRGAIQMHIGLLLREATAQIKKDYSGSVAAFDESQRQGMQMADMLSEGIMKQFPSRFNNKATTVSSR